LPRRSKDNDRIALVGVNPKIACLIKDKSIRALKQGMSHEDILEAKRVSRERCVAIGFAR